jgi:hydroxyacylglutathione hydrolase
MKNWKTDKGTQIHRLLSGRSNVYLIIKDNDLILVDTGMPSAFSRLCRILHSLNFSIDSIKTLVLTHTHFDHCRSAKRIQEISGCQIIVSCEASECIQKGYTRLPKGTLFITGVLSKMGNYIGKRGFGYKPFRADVTVNGELSMAGIKIMETKGHSDDSISVIVDDEIAIVGDTMIGTFRNSIFPPFADNIPEMVQSWRTLLETGCKIYLPGHGNAIGRTLIEANLLRYT